MNVVKNKKGKLFRIGILLLITLLTCHNLDAQEIWMEKYVPAQNILHIRTKPFSAFTLRLKKGKYLMPDIFTQNHKMELDEHVTHGDMVQSVLYIRRDSVLTIFNCQGLDLEVIFQNVPVFSNTPDTRLLRRNVCTQPSMISPAEWRVGLADPKPGPSATDLRHCIIHHSAGGNGSTNYVDLVRNYYVQHTQVNGWDDIGYNFLVAYDGTVFIGRDKQSLNISQYRVKGAHYCAKNSGTTGICLIGNYNDLKPSDTMLSSLEHILAWILFTEKRSALDSTPHPTPLDSYLNHIAGHRQGCATACPGDSVFQVLDTLRYSTERRRKECDQWVSVVQLGDEFKINLANQRITVFSQNSWYLFTSTGALIHVSISRQHSSETIRLKPGIYIIKYSKGVRRVHVPSE